MKASTLFTMFCAVLASASVLPHRAGNVEDIEKIEKEEIKGVFSETNDVKRIVAPEELDNGDEVDFKDLNGDNDLDKRADRRTVCKWGGNGPGSTIAFHDGIDYINDNWSGADCVVEAGPSKCKRFTCSWDSGIWLCNDTKEQLRVPCKDIASMAQKIMDECSWYDWKPRAQGKLLVLGFSLNLY
ncbi:hypothetical protein QQX98_008583 [Neonectria punicea]|uniref:Uncharacterized protein n=1 Tax=Neonectria punicea TaxID=979145 RepID=A0ABR1GUK2_9HYPO